MARRLEGAGDFAGAQAALDRAVQASPKSAELRGQVASFYLRRSQPDEAEKAAKAGLGDRREQHRGASRARAGVCRLRRRGHRRAREFAGDPHLSQRRDHAPRARGRRRRQRRPRAALHAGPALLAHRSGVQGGRVAEPRRVAQPRIAAGAARAGAGARGQQEPADGDRDPRAHRGRRAARGRAAGAVSGTGGPLPRRRRLVHQGARSATR